MTEQEYEAALAAYSVIWNDPAHEDEADRLGQLIEEYEDAELLAMVDSGPEEMTLEAQMKHLEQYIVLKEPHDKL